MFHILSTDQSIAEWQQIIYSCVLIPGWPLFSQWDFRVFLTWFYFHLTFHPLSLLVTEATAHNLLLLLFSVHALKAVQATSELGLVFYWYVYGLTHLGLSVESHSCCWSCFGKDVATTLCFFSGSFSFQWQTWIRHSRRRDVTCKGSAWISEGCEGRNNYLALRKCDN